jgi:DNA-binding MarR family transcriptional regulator
MVASADTLASAALLRVCTSVSSDADLDVLFACACFNVRMASRALSTFYDQQLEPSGLKVNQLVLLGAVRAAGAIPMQGLAQLLGLDPSTLSRTLQPLQSEGLIRIEESEQDRRIREVVLTAAGHRRYGEAREGWQAAQAALRDKLGAPRFERILTDLKALVRAVSEK